VLVTWALNGSSHHLRRLSTRLTAPAQVGRGYVLAGGEHKDEVLASKPAHP